MWTADIVVGECILDEKMTAGHRAFVAAVAQEGTHGVQLWHHSPPVCICRPSL